MFFFSSLRSSNSCPDIYRNAISGGGAKAKVLTALAEDSNECSSRCSNSCDSCLHSLVDHLPMAGLASWKKFCNAPFVLFLVSNFILYAFNDITRKIPQGFPGFSAVSLDFPYFPEISHAFPGFLMHILSACRWP